MHKKGFNRAPKLDLTRRQRMHILLAALLLVIAMAYAIYLGVHTSHR